MIGDMCARRWYCVQGIGGIVLKGIGGIVLKG
jgi:hypothetical protein